MGKKVLLTQSPALDKHSTNTQGWEEAKAFKLSNCLQFLKAATQSLIKIHPKGQARQPRWLTGLSRNTYSVHVSVGHGRPAETVVVPTLSKNVFPFCFLFLSSFPDPSLPSSHSSILPHVYTDATLLPLPLIEVIPLELVPGSRWGTYHPESDWVWCYVLSILLASKVGPAPPCNPRGQHLVLYRFSLSQTDTVLCALTPTFVIFIGFWFYICLLESHFFIH